jgi:hypothetical protein
MNFVLETIENNATISTTVNKDIIDFYFKKIKFESL